MSNFYNSYNLALVALSFGVASIASLTALDLAGRVRFSTGVANKIWLVGGAFAMGTGIWAMHFIGMLAMEMHTKVGYGVTLTIISLIAAILSSALALAIVQTSRLTHYRLAVGSLVMGTGICLMHYVGMEAMQTAGTLSYQPALFFVSVVISVSASAIALWLVFRLNPKHTSPRTPLWQRGVAALIMAMGISGMHYTGMAAVTLPESMTHQAAGGISSDQLAIVIALISTCIMLAALMISVYDSNLTSRNAQLASSLKQANRELKSVIYRDSLTQLPNRLMLEERLDAMLAQPNSEFAVFFVDLDRFKRVNDSLGHQVGDELIKCAALRLKGAVRETDMVARVGGDEFMVLVAKSSEHRGYTSLARRIVSTLDKPFQIAGSIVKVSSSVGISLYPDHGDDKHALMTHADAAMYCAKEKGRNTFQFYKHDMSSLAERRSVLEQRLRLALENDTLSLGYQPKVDVMTGDIIGVEALLRWKDDELGTVTPDEIIPLAEDTGLILPLGEWVLRTACQYSAKRDQETDTIMPIAVNISAIQLNSRNFTTMVKRVLQETKLPPECLELELTESALIQNPDHALVILTELRELGVKLSIDDFGTGYSNLAQLKRFPIDYLKIDRTFMSGVTSDAQDAAIVQAVVALAHNLGLQVVAEGIETEDQLSFIRNLQGHQYQGYLCSKALSASELKVFLAKRDLVAVKAGSTCKSEETLAILQGKSLQS